MTSPDAGHWQIQEAKQRFSEMIRAVTSEGPQVITRHGEDGAVVVDIAEYRRLTRPTGGLAGSPPGGPIWSPASAPPARHQCLSETRKRRPAPGVASWIADPPAGRLHVSVLT